MLSGLHHSSKATGTPTQSLILCYLSIIRINKNLIFHVAKMERDFSPHRFFFPYSLSMRNLVVVNMDVHFFKINLFIYLFIYFWLSWVFVSVWGLSLVAASRGHSSSRCAGLSLSRPLLLRSTGSRCAGSVIVAHGPSCSAACGIFPDQGSNLCPLHWQADSQPLCHQGSPGCAFLKEA